MNSHDWQPTNPNTFPETIYWAKLVNLNLSSPHWGINGQSWVICKNCNLFKTEYLHHDYLTTFIILWRILPIISDKYPFELIYHGELNALSSKYNLTCNEEILL